MFAWPVCNFSYSCHSAKMNCHFEYAFEIIVKVRVQRDLNFVDLTTFEDNVFDVNQLRYFTG